MTEFQAIALTIAVTAFTNVIAIAVLAAVHANGYAMAVAFVVILAVGADTCSRIGMSYSDKRRRR
jgi:hypothetical protein